MLNASAGKKFGFETRYTVVLAACAIQFTIIGLLFSYGLFFKVFEVEFGWSRTLLSANASLAFFMMGVLAIVVGRLSDRFGPRIVLGVTGTVFGVGFASIAAVGEPWQLFMIFGVCIGLSMSSHDVVTLSTVSRWFDRRRGVMTGVVKTGTALGQMCLPPIAALLIAGLSWRPAAVVLGAMAVVVLLAAALTMKNPPRRAIAANETTSAGLSFSVVAKTRMFWTLCAIQVMYLPTLSTVPLHVVVHGMDLGMPAAEAAILLSVIGGSSILGRLAIGAFADRIGGRLALASCFLPLIFSLSGLLALRESNALFWIVGLYGFAHGGLFTIMAPTIAEYFGTRAHGTIFGAMLFFGATGGAIGPILAGRAFDVTGSYAPAFATLAVMACIALVLALSLPRRADRPVVG